MSGGGPHSPRIFYGWYIVVAAFLVIAISHGLQNSFGVFLKPLAEGFGWSRSLTAGAFMLYLILRGISGTVMGRLTDRYGPRLIVGLGALLMGVGMLLSSMMSSVWQLYVFYGVLVGVGMGVGVVPLSATISRWFIARRGLALGLMGMGAGLSNVIISPLAGYLLRNLGISKAYLIMGSLALVLISVGALVLRKEPGDLGLRPYGAGAYYTEGVAGLREGEAVESGGGTSRALRSGFFWVLATVSFLVGMGGLTIMTNIVAHATDLGISEAVAPYLLSIIGGSQVAGMIIMGIVSEKIGVRRVLVLCLGIAVVALFWLTGASSFTSFCIVAAIFGFGIGGAILQLLGITAELFGLRSLGATLGLVWLANLMGAALGSEVGNLIYDFTQPHSYRPAFWMGGGVYMAAMLLALVMMRPRLT